MTTGEGVAISVGVTVVLFAVGEVMRPKGARVFNKGKNGETDLLFDPLSVPKK